MSSADVRQGGIGPWTGYRVVQGPTSVVTGATARSVVVSAVVAQALLRHIGMRIAIPKLSSSCRLRTQRTLNYHQRQLRRAGGPTADQNWRRNTSSAASGSHHVDWSCPLLGERNLLSRKQDLRLCTATQLKRQTLHISMPNLVVADSVICCRSGIHDCSVSHTQRVGHARLRGVEQAPVGAAASAADCA